MIKIIDENTSKSGPWVAEFGEYERVLDGRITPEECETLDQSSPEVEVLRCRITNIDHTKLHKHSYYLLERTNGKIETWLYEGLGRIDNSYNVFTRPSLRYEEAINVLHQEYKFQNKYTTVEVGGLFA